jgi:hypothetical protein
MSLVEVTLILEMGKVCLRRCVEIAAVLFLHDRVVSIQARSYYQFPIRHTVLDVLYQLHEPVEASPDAPTAILSTPVCEAVGMVFPYLLRDSDLVPGLVEPLSATTCIRLRQMWTVPAEVQSFRDYPPRLISVRDR